MVKVIDGTSRYEEVIAKTDAQNTVPIYGGIFDCNCR